MERKASIEKGDQDKSEPDTRVTSLRNSHMLGMPSTEFKVNGEAIRGCHSDYENS